MSVVLAAASWGIAASAGAQTGSGGTTTTTSAGTKSASDPLASLKITAGKVDVRRGGKQSFKPAKNGQKLHEGDTIRTDATGQAEVDYFGDGSSYTRLDVSTTFTIVSLTDNQGNRKVEGSLESGQTWNRTVKLSESQSFQQDGAGANATVLGTAFMVKCDTPDHCEFTAVVDNIDLTGKDGVKQILQPLDQCDSTTGVLCGNISTIPADQLPQWITDNLLQDVKLGFPDGGLLGTIVVQNGSVFFVPAPAPTVVAGETVTRPATAPGSPTNVQAVVGNGQATVSFSPPASDGGSPIISYTAHATPGAGGASISAAASAPSASGPSSPIVVTGLTNGTPYTFTVTATNAVGTSPGSSPSNSVTTPTVPGAPTVVSATRGDQAADVSWSVPLSDGGSSITGYSVTASSGGGGCTAAAATSCTVRGLTNGSSYSFSVTAKNAVGTGPAAVSGSVTVGFACAAAASDPAISFDGSPGTAAPPSTLGTCAMTAFGSDPRPLFADVANLDTPGGGSLLFSSALSHRQIDSGWATWSNGYTGDVYYVSSNGVTLTLPTNTLAFYFYAEPNRFQLYNIIATAQDGTTSTAVPVQGLSGAQYFGFSTSSYESPISTVAVAADPGAGGFAVGQFGISQGPDGSASAASTPGTTPDTTPGTTPGTTPDTTPAG